MRTRIFLLGCLLGIATIAAAQQTTRVFFDDFNTGTRVSSSLWHIPTWVSPSDGTYVGRTQFRCSQNAPLPLIEDGQARIDLDTYNPTGFSFYGTDLLTNKRFTPGDGLIITVRAKMKTPTSRGYVGGIFFYDLTGTGGIHDEIDYELLTNDQDKVHDNIYSDEPLGAGHPSATAIATPITEYHTYVIKWLPDKVEWIVDGNVIRTETVRVPNGNLHFHLNIWAPAAEWLEAYDVALQPTNVKASNVIYTMLVDYVQIDSLTSVPTSIDDRKIVQNGFYPNPAQDRITFSAPGAVDALIYTMTGSKVLERKAATGTLSLEGLKPGLYLMRYTQDGLTRSAKLVVK
jgi:hypothetical protein